MLSRTLRSILVATALLLLIAPQAHAGSVGSDCTKKGKKLWGKVKVVTSFPDLRVQIVSSFPDLKVQKVRSFPSSCGKWKFVDSFPDLRIMFVKSFPDLKISYVTSFPGVR